MVPITKNKNNRARPLSQKPAAIKLRELRKNRNHEERLTERINAQRRGAVRRARSVLDDTAWAELEDADRKVIWCEIEQCLRQKYDKAAKNGEDTLSTSGEVQKAIINAFEKYAGLFVPEGEDDPLPCELF